MTTGTVKFFNTTKGFGFIEQGGGQPDVFVHISAVERAGMRSLVEGQKVSFDVVKDQRPNALRPWPLTTDVLASGLGALGGGRGLPRPSSFQTAR